MSGRPGALVADLPTIAITPAERQRIARLSIEQVSVTVDKASERVDVEVQRTGDLVEPHSLSRPVKRCDLQSDYPRLVERLQTWCGEQLSAAQIAERLYAAGFRPPKRADRFTVAIMRRLLWHLELDRRQPHGSLMALCRDEYCPIDLARKLDVSRDTVRRWLRIGWLTARRDADGHHVIWPTPRSCVGFRVKPPG
jgi:hypothetical protein